MRRGLNFGLLILMAVSAFADPKKKIAGDLPDNDNRPFVDVIVQFTRAPGNAQHNKVARPASADQNSGRFRTKSKTSEARRTKVTHKLVLQMDWHVFGAGLIS